MFRIVSAITTFEQHFGVLNEYEDAEQTTDAYAPSCCPHCGLKRLWRHGFYERKADRTRSGDRSHNPVPICRYFCPDCSRSCSRLPLCIAPRRWYGWALQQSVLQNLFNQLSVHYCSRMANVGRHTVRRWWNWLHARSETFIFRLLSRYPDLGRVDVAQFWPTLFSGMGLARAMGALDTELTVP
jgi:transposase-like protein